MPMRFAQLGGCVRRRRQRIRGLRAGRPGRMTFYPARAFPRRRLLYAAMQLPLEFQGRTISTTASAIRFVDGRSLTTKLDGRSGYSKRCAMIREGYDFSQDYSLDKSSAGGRS
jgi:hypothetical protein